MAHVVRGSARGRPRVNRFGVGAHRGCGTESVLDSVLASLAGMQVREANAEPRRCSSIWPAAPLALRAEVRQAAHIARNISLS
jgi:hypothetical protein